MNRPKFVRVIAAPLPRAGTDTAGFRRAGDVLPHGSVVPVEWFQDTPDAVFVHLINPPEAGGMGVIEACEPDMKLLAVLREQYPAAFTAPDKANSTAQVSTKEDSKSTRSSKKDYQEEAE